MGGLPGLWFLEIPMGGSGNRRFVASTAPGGATDLKAARAAFMLFKS